MPQQVRQVILDGVDVTKDVILGDSFSIELSRDEETRTAVYALTSDLELVGDAYTIVYDRFIPQCFSCDKKLPLTILTECCSLQLNFELLVEGVSFDFPTCSVKITGLQTTGATTAFRYLQNHIWWRDGSGNLLVDQVRGAKVMYFIEPSWWQRLTMIFRNFGNSRYHFYHVAPTLYDICLWNADKAGLGFISNSIFGAFAEYKDLAILYASNREGPSIGRGFDFIEDNYPIETLIGLLDKFRLVFNADFRIIGSNLVFETLEYWEQNAEVIDDYNLLIEEGRLKEGGTTAIDSTTNKAYGRYEYFNDAIDSASNRQHYFYSDLIEWNPGGSNECLRGEKTNAIDFSSTHVIGDEGYWKRREDENLDVMDRISRQNPDAKLFMTTGQAQYPKLITLSPNWRNEGTYVTPKFRNNGYIRETGWEVSFREDEPEGLYNRFHIRDDPSRTSYINLGTLNYIPTNFCETVLKIQEFGVEVAISTPWGKGLPESIDIEFSEGTIILNNILVRCVF